MIGQRDPYLDVLTCSGNWQPTVVALFRLFNNISLSAHINILEWDYKRKLATLERLDSSVTDGYSLCKFLKFF